MEYISYIIVSLVAFLGLIVGSVLAFVSPEEMKPGRKYFIFMRRTLFVIISAFTLYLLWDSNLLFFIFGVLFIFFYMKLLDKPVIYLMIGAYIPLSFHLAQYTAVIASLAFLFGMPAGSLYVSGSSKKKKMILLKEAVIRHFLYYVIPIIALPFVLFYL